MPGASRVCRAIRCMGTSLSVLRLTGGEPRNHERAQDDDAVEELLPDRRHAGEVEHVVDQLEGDGTGQRAEDTAPPTVETDAADHRGREDLEDHALTLAGRDRSI